MCVALNRRFEIGGFSFRSGHRSVYRLNFEFDIENFLVCCPNTEWKETTKWKWDRNMKSLTNFQLEKFLSAQVVCLWYLIYYLSCVNLSEFFIKFFRYTAGFPFLFLVEKYCLICVGTGYYVTNNRFTVHTQTHWRTLKLQFPKVEILLRGLVLSHFIDRSLYSPA